MNDIQTKLNIILKEVCVRYFYAIIIASSLFAIYYWYEGIEPLNYIVGVCPIVHLLLIFIPYKLDYESIRSLIPVYLIYVSAFLYSQVLYFWPLGQITAFMWYSIIPVAAMLFFKRRTVVIWGIYVLVLICSVFIVSPFIQVGDYTPPTEKQLAVTNIMTIVLSIIFVIFFVYYLNKVNLIKVSQLIDYRTDVAGDTEVKPEVDKFESLYIEILSYFSEKKPYCDADFTITQLAKDLNSNVKYVSRVIKIRENVNFNVFLNMYRINFVKEQIAKDYHNKYTIKYIYISAGFRHQSTFNKVFKEIEGITPSEYIKNNKMKSTESLK
jgi:AraC-like DNA-binding protein